MKQFFLLIFIFVAGTRVGAAKESGETVVVVYNSRVKESKDVALHYAQQRKVPEEQVVGFDLPTSETMTRSEYRIQLEKPLLKFLEKKKLFSFRANLEHTGSEENRPKWKLAPTKIRYAVLCYGVPSRIAADKEIVEPEADKLKSELRRNEAAVDTELALLPLNNPKRVLTGPTINPLIATTG